MADQASPNSASRAETHGPKRSYQRTSAAGKRGPRNPVSATTYQHQSARMFRRSPSGTFCDHVRVSLAGESYCCAEGGLRGARGGPRATTGFGPFLWSRCSKNSSQRLLSQASAAGLAAGAGGSPGPVHSDTPRSARPPCSNYLKAWGCGAASLHARCGWQHAFTQSPAPAGRLRRRARGGAAWRRSTPSPPSRASALGRDRKRPERQ